MVDLASIVARHLAAGGGNPDGIHWSWQCHAEVGHAVAEAVRKALATGGTLGG
jgi:hypothetical protein